LTKSFLHFSHSGRDIVWDYDISADTETASDIPVTDHDTSAGTDTYDHYFVDDKTAWDGLALLDGIAVYIGDVKKVGAG